MTVVSCFRIHKPCDFAQEVFAEIVKFAAKECPEMAIGIGSIVDPATAAMYLQTVLLRVGPLFTLK
jgi:2-dehydro-3-deoxyphosphogluconate aldolase/(4S)-4-hydroxy-2-oxoglutarate aldolase